MLEDKKKYGGLFLYRVTTPNSEKYIVSHPDQTRNILNNPGLDDDFLKDTANIKIEKVKEVLINPLTLDRLVAEATIK